MSEFTLYNLPQEVPGNKNGTKTFELQFAGYQISAEGKE
jgi:hypothetical protein